VDNESIIDLQTRIAHHEHTIAQLNAVLADQQMRIAGLENQIKALMDRVRVLSDGVPTTESADERPPHY